MIRKTRMTSETKGFITSKRTNSRRIWIVTYDLFQGSTETNKIETTVQVLEDDIKEII